MNTTILAGGEYSQVDRPSRFGLAKVILTILIAVLVGILHISGIFPPDDPPSYRIQIAAMAVGLMLVISAGKIGNFSKLKLIMLFLWSGFALMTLLSALVYDEKLQAVIWVCVGVPYLIFCVIPHASGRHGNVMILVAIILGLMPYIVWSLAKYSVVAPFRGVFENNNSFGMTVTTVTACLLALLRGAIPAKRKNVLQWLWIVGLSMSVVGAFLLILVSNSRTSLLCFSVLLMIFLGSLLFNTYKNRYWIVLAIAIMLGAMTFFAGSVFLDNNKDGYANKMITKIETKWKSGDVSDGRIPIWKAVVNDITLLGRGGSIFPAYYGGLAHNTYITVLGSVGIVALVFVTVIHGLVLFLACRMVVKNIRNDGYSIGPLLVVMNFFALGMTELVFGLLGNGINMTFLLMTGVLINAQGVGEAAIKFSPEQQTQAQLGMQLGGEAQ